MIHLLPQLPCRNRYTEDWIKVWSRELNKLVVAFTVWGHDVPTPITRFFTDPDYALRYECDQIRTLSQIDHLEKIFCLDVDFPGLLSAAIPVLKLRNPGLKCFGYLHAGSWNNGDIFGEIPGKKQLERAMFDVYDKIFVATWYHKYKIQSYFNRGFKNLHVVGFPFYKEDVLSYADPLPFEEKKGILILGRLEQSNVSLLDRLRRKFRGEIVNPEAYIGDTNRAGYFHQLNKAKVVLSLKTEETFGIGQLEAYVLGSIPLSPNRFAYPEVIGDSRLLYKVPSNRPYRITHNEKDLISKLAFLLEIKKNPFHIDIEKYRQVIPTCVAGF